MARKKLEDLSDEELKDLLESTSERMHNIRERVDEIEYELARRYRETMQKVDTSRDIDLMKSYRCLGGDAGKANSEFFRVLVRDEGSDRRLEKSKIRIECPEFLRGPLTITASRNIEDDRVVFFGSY